MSTAALAVPGHNNPPDLSTRLAEDYEHLPRQVEEVANLANAAPKTIDDEESLAAVGRIVVEARTLSARIEGIRKNEKEPHLEAGRAVDAFFKVFIERLDRIGKALADRANDFNRRKLAEERRQREELARKQREEEDRQREIARKAEEAGRLGAAAKAQDRADLAADRAAAAGAQAQAKAADLTRVRGDDGTVTSASAKWDFEIVDLQAVDLGALRPYLPRDAIDKAIRQFVRIHKNSTALAGVRIFEDVRTNFR